MLIGGPRRFAPPQAAPDGRKYTPILNAPYRWKAWAAPKGKDGKIDHNTALTGDDLIQFVNAKLFPYLHGFKARATGPNTLEYKIGEIFGEIKNRLRRGYCALIQSTSRANAPGLPSERERPISSIRVRSSLGPDRV